MWNSENRYPTIIEENDVNSEEDNHINSPQIINNRSQPNLMNNYEKELSSIINSKLLATKIGFKSKRSSKEHLSILSEMNCHSAINKSKCSSHSKDEYTYSIQNKEDESINKHLYKKIEKQIITILANLGISKEINFLQAKTIFRTLGMIDGNDDELFNKFWSQASFSNKIEIQTLKVLISVILSASSKSSNIVILGIESKKWESNFSKFRINRMYNGMHLKSGENAEIIPNKKIIRNIDPKSKFKYFMGVNNLYKLTREKGQADKKLRELKECTFIPKTNRSTSKEVTLNESSSVISNPNNRTSSIKKLRICHSRQDSLIQGYSTKDSRSKSNMNQSQKILLIPKTENYNAKSNSRQAKITGFQSKPTFHKRFISSGSDGINTKENSLKVSKDIRQNVINFTFTNSCKPEAIPLKSRNDSNHQSPQKDFLLKLNIKINEKINEEIKIYSGTNTNSLIDDLGKKHNIDYKKIIELKKSVVKELEKRINQRNRIP